jgi:glutamine cyclotransferase
MSFVRRDRFLLLVLLIGCLFINSQQTSGTKRAPVSGYTVLQSINHDVTAYTQGLFVHEGIMYETTGQYGESSLRKVDMKSGKVLQKVNFDSKYFVEGSCTLNGVIYILTWTQRVCFIYDLKSFKRLGQIPLRREGWGITTDGKELIMSDGSSKLYFTDPNTFIDKRVVNVTLNGRPISYINELEYIDGKVWANIYTDNSIVVINPTDGVIERVIDCSDILPSALKSSRTDVFNGIAYDKATNSIYVTGKYWPKMYKISIK